MRWGWLFLVLVLILQYRIWFDDSGVLATWKIQEQVSVKQEENKVLETRNEWLRKDVVNLQTTNDVVEEKAREDLGLIQKDESFYLFVDEK